MLIAAYDLFASQGFQATTTKQIAQRAQVATGSVYQKFPNKQALLEAVIAPLANSMFSSVADQFINTVLSKQYDTLTDFATALLTNRITFLDQHFPEMKIMLDQVLTNQELQASFKKDMMETMRSYLGPHIQHLRDQGQIIDLPNDIIIATLVAPITLHFSKLLLMNSVRSLNEDIDYSIKMVVRALSPRQ